MAHHPDALAARIRAARAYKGLSQEELAASLGYNPSTIKRLETGRVARARKTDLMAIAQICDVPLAFLDPTKPLAIDAPADEELRATVRDLDESFRLLVTVLITDGDEQEPDGSDDATQARIVAAREALSELRAKVRRGALPASREAASSEAPSPSQAAQPDPAST